MTSLGDNNFNVQNGGRIIKPKKPQNKMSDTDKLLKHNKFSNQIVVDKNEAMLKWIQDHEEELSAYEAWKAEQSSWTRKFKFGVEHISFEGFTASFSMIVISELGDKTFFIAAILAMRESRTLVFIGACGALALMTVLGVIFGHLLTVIPVEITHYGAGILFFIFGIKLLYESRSMNKGVSNELREVEEELYKKNDDISGDDDSDISNLELGIKNKNKKQKNIKPLKSKYNFSIVINSFIMTFISEIGDRSQITTIVLAAHKNPWGVTFGATGGHALCTGIAVLGGKLLASRISEKNVAICGGVLFLLFGVECLLYGPVE